MGGDARRPCALEGAIPWYVRWAGDPPTSTRKERLKASSNSPGYNMTFSAKQRTCYTGTVCVAPDSHIGPITGISDRRPIWTLIPAIKAPCISADVGLILARYRRSTRSRRDRCAKIGRAPIVSLRYLRGPVCVLTALLARCVSVWVPGANRHRCRGRCQSPRKKLRKNAKTLNHRMKRMIRMTRKKRKQGRRHHPFDCRRRS